MPTFAICRTEKIKSWSSLTKSVGHNLRTGADERPHLNASAPDPLRVLCGAPDWVAAWRTDVTGMHLRQLAQGQSHTLAREFFLGMSPEWAEGKSPADIDAWAEANVEWLRARFGADRVRLAVLHLDEQTPHLAAYVVPLAADTNRAGQVRTDRGNGWTLSDRVLGLGGGKDALVKLQDEYAAAMKRFALERGRRNSKAKHQTAGLPSAIPRERVDLTCVALATTHGRHRLGSGRGFPWSQLAALSCARLAARIALSASARPTRDACAVRPHRESPRGNGTNIASASQSASPRPAALARALAARQREPITRRPTMSDTLQPSPMLEAIDLIRINIDALSDEELEEHAARVVAILLELTNAQAEAIWTSAIAATNIARLAKKLLAHLARVKEAVEARQTAAGEGEELATPTDRRHGAVQARRPGF